MNSVALIELKMTLEFGVAPLGSIVPIATNEQDDQPVVLVSRLADDYRMYLREDVPVPIRGQLCALGAGRCYDEEDAVRAILANKMPCRDVRRIRWYVATRRPASIEYADVRCVDGRYVIMREGREVARAESGWETDEAAEVAIETHPDYR